jgi:hypothetical protein
VYVRIPKTASTTFKEILGKMAEEKNLRILYQLFDAIHDKNLRGPFDLSLHHVIFNSGNAVRLRSLLPKCHFITSVRDPLARARSDYNHVGPNGHINVFAEKGVPFHKWYMKHKDDEGGYAGWRGVFPVRHWTNGTLASFMGFTEPGFTYEHFCERYAFVLVAEQFELSLRVFEALSDVSLPRVDPMRVARYDKLEVPEEVKAAFRERNELDYVLYEYGCRRLREQAQEMNCDEQVQNTICSDEG